MLRICLRSIEKYAPQNLTQVIVADSATQEDTALMMREDFPQVLFLPHKKNVGFGAMVNACIDHVTTTYVFFINADTIVEEHTVQALFAFMQEHPDIALTGPAQKNFNNQRENTRFEFYRPQTILYRRTFLKHFAFAQKHLAWFEMRQTKQSTPYPVPWVIGSAMFVRTTALDDIGGMDPRFFMYMEDVDWCRRLWEHGWKVYYHPGITLYHFYGKGSARGTIFVNLFSNRLIWIHLTSGIKYFLKYRGKKQPHIYA